MPPKRAKTGREGKTTELKGKQKVFKFAKTPTTPINLDSSEKPNIGPPAKTLEKGPVEPTSAPLSRKRSAPNSEMNPIEERREQLKSFPLSYSKLILGFVFFEREENPNAMGAGLTMRGCLILLLQRTIWDSLNVAARLRKP
jgi:hypothetical protein